MKVEELGIDPDCLSRVTAAIEADVECEHYDGAVVLAARRGEIVYHEAIGYADRATGRKAKTDDVFHIWSLTKTFTTAAIFRLVERDLIQFNTPVSEIIPEFGTKGKQRVTVA